MAEYDVSDIIGKTLYPVRVIDVYDHPDGNIIGSINPPAPAGIVYSWVNGADGSLWWMFESKNSNLGNQYGSYYIKQVGGIFDVQALRAQGVITIKEKEALEKQKKKDTLDRIGDIVKWAAGIIAGAVLTKAVFDYKRKK